MEFQKKISIATEKQRNLGNLPNSENGYVFYLEAAKKVQEKAKPIEILDYVNKGYQAKNFFAMHNYLPSNDYDIKISYRISGTSSIIIQLSKWLLEFADRHKNQPDIASKTLLQNLYLCIGMTRNINLQNFETFNLFNREKVQSLLKLRAIIIKNSDRKLLKYIQTELQRIKEFDGDLQTLCNMTMLTEDHLNGAVRKGNNFFQNYIIEKNRHLAQNWYLQKLGIYNRRYLELERPVSQFAYNTHCSGYDRYGGRTILFLSTGALHLKCCQTLLDGLILLCALKIYKIDHQEYPDSIRDLSPDYVKKIPVNEFSNNGIFVYDKRFDKILFYSIGGSMADFGGKDSNPLDFVGDIVFMKPEWE